MAVSNGPWLLDTSILVDILRGYKPTRDWVDSIPPADRFVSVITAAELLAGCRNQTEQRAVERELALYAMLWLDEGASQAALEWYRRFHLSHGIGFLDCLIAATAVERGLRLATLNLKHFAPLTNVHAERPH
jgi:predicted nucleic acid-binding protein